jgi:hypothetical protein
MASIFASIVRLGSNALVLWACAGLAVAGATLPADSRGQTSDTTQTSPPPAEGVPTGPTAEERAEAAAAAKKFVDAVARLSTMYKCRGCEGKGFTIERRTTVKRNALTDRKTTTHSNEEVPCTVCAEARYSDGELIAGRLEDAAEALSQVGLRDEKVDQRINAMRERLREVLNLDPEKLAQLINPHGVERINNAVAGTIVVFVRLGNDERTWTRQPPSPTYPYVAGYDIEVYLDNPRLTQADLTGDLLIGGVLSFDDAGRPMVSRGFVVGAR